MEMFDYFLYISIQIRKLTTLAVEGYFVNKRNRPFSLMKPVLLHWMTPVVF